MKLFIKILLFILVALVVNVNVTSATITFPNIQVKATSLSFHKEIPRNVLKVIENDLANCCQNESDLVDYKDKGIGVEAVPLREEQAFGRQQVEEEQLSMALNTQHMH